MAAAIRRAAPQSPAALAIAAGVDRGAPQGIVRTGLADLAVLAAIGETAAMWSPETEPAPAHAETPT
ncbi:MAG: hypothetical protein IT374_26340 [Polyangiaceae bacterium]|nr:hypothetical protein [Polyangiaceae bacterium]